MFEAWESGWGLNVVQAVQSFQHPVFDWLAQFLDLVGGDYGYLIALPLIYWALSRRLGRWLLVVLCLALIAIVSAKELLMRPRPFVFAPEAVRQLVEEGGYGFPSGHAGISTALWGFVALWVWAESGWKRGRVIIAVTVILYILLMAWARMYAGAHYPQDVIGGTIIGAVVAFGVFYSQATLTALWGRLPGWAQGVVLGVLAVLTAVLLHGDDTGISAAGILLGGGIGLALELQYVQFMDGAPLIRRVVRFIAGLIITFVVFLGLDAAFEAIRDPSITLRVVRYALVAAVILGVYPWLMVRTGLAQRAPSLQNAPTHLTRDVALVGSVVALIGLIAMLTVFPVAT